MYKPKPSEVAWVKMIDKLSDDHIEVMKQCENGATIWGFETARLLREVQAFDWTLIRISNWKDCIKFDPQLKRLTASELEERSPYFYAVLTMKGNITVMEGLKNEQTKGDV